MTRLKVRWDKNSVSFVMFDTKVHEITDTTA